MSAAFIFYLFLKVFGPGGSPVLRHMLATGLLCINYFTVI